MGENRIDMTQSPVTMFNAWLRKSGGLPAEAADAASDVSVFRRFEADDLLFSAGERPDVLYFIQSGLVRFFYLTDDGKEFNKNFVAVGSVVTSLSTFLSGVPSPFFTQALEQTVTIALPMEFVRRQMETRHPLGTVVEPVRCHAGAQERAAGGVFSFTRCGRAI
jgi:CRP-like cAMP-binding protein